MSLQTDDGGGPGKRTPFEPRPLNLSFGIPPADKVAIWAKRKAEHKPPLRVDALVGEIGYIAEMLKRAGVYTQSIREMVSEIAVIDRFEHMDCLSIQTLERIRQKLSDELKKIWRGI